jgi:hypothetical protein
MGYNLTDVEALTRCTYLWRLIAELSPNRLPLGVCESERLRLSLAFADQALLARCGPNMIANCVIVPMFDQ